MAKVYSSIFLLKGISDLSSVTKKFNDEYKELLKHAKKDEKMVKRMSELEKYFIYSWKEFEKIEKMEVPSLSLREGEEEASDDEIKFQKAIANIEYTKRKRKDKNGNFLPKNERLNNIDIQVVFFEKENKVYVLILTSNEYNIQRVKKLVGFRNLSVINEEYSLETNMFNWLFYVYTNQDGKLSEELKLENINGFVGNVTDDANIFTGSSHHTTELIVTKAFISNGGDLKNIAIRIRDKEIDLTCMVNDKSTAIITTNLSEKLRILDSLDKKTFFLLYFYSFIIPKLKDLYSKKAEVFVQEDNPEFSKQIGIEVIESIVEKNGIKFEDLTFIKKDLEKRENKKNIKTPAN